VTQPIVDLQSVREAGNLISVEDAVAVLQTTEPMVEYEFNLDGTDNVKFFLPDGWNDGIEDTDSSELTDCTIDVSGNQVRLTREALLTMTSAVGLQKPYVLKTPGPLIEPHLNYWINNNGVAATDAMKLMVKDDEGVGFIKSSKAVFPNLPVLEKVLERIEAKFKIPSHELYVDYKIEHSLERTALRLILPEISRTISSARSNGQNDEWSLGIQITNSMMGHPETRLNVSGYLFAWWCTNGSISQHATSGNYNRRVQGQDFEEVIDWIGANTDHIFNDLNLELQDVEDLAEMSLVGELNTVVLDVFKELKVPKPVRKPILDFLIDSDDLTGYGLMQAITQSANSPDVTDKVRENTMRIGGTVPSVLADRCGQCHRIHL
jgi:hypothetical protein